mgnify:CR=1 FL=1
MLRDTRWAALAVAGTLVTLLALAGCVTVVEPWQGGAAVASPAVQDCAVHFSALDEAVDRAGVRDAEAARISGFPYARLDRFSASLLERARNEDRAHVQWLTRLQALDAAARRVEISNLADADVNTLQRNGGGRAALLEQTLRCGALLREHDQSSPDRVEKIRARAQVPDAYLTWQRMAGLYGVTQVPFSRGIAKWHAEAMRDFQLRDNRKTAHPVTRHALADGPEPLPNRAQVAALLRRAADNPLGLPDLSEAEKNLLLRAYAPVFEVETGGDYDRVGRLQWTRDGTPQVDVTRPVVYQRVALTRFGEATLLQLVYTAWFSERPSDHPFDLLAGKLDGVVIRITLSADGDPLVYDTIHPCGCYHMFFPTGRVEAVAAPDGAGEWAFAPVTLPAHVVGQRVAVTIATRSHYVVQVRLDPADSASASHGYALVPEDDLRTLPFAAGTRSLYAPDGLVAGTERGERFFFWPMGIPSAGAMRQWGHHATAFVGRRHFDDADIIERRFRIVTP